MHDLPSQAVLQQAKARPISGEELEVMGKHAASCFLGGQFPSLTEAVVETVKQAGLSPEQVLRVIEFTNQSAYQQEFSKEGSAHKYIHFHGGPASPSEVLKDLNDGGGGTVFDRALADFKTSPSFSKTAASKPMEKTAEVFDPVETAFADAFKTADNHLPFLDPMQDTVAAREKLASVRDSLTSELSSLEVGYHDLLDDLYGQVKQAALEEMALGYIVQAWAVLNPAPGFVKVAFQHIGPRLAEEGVLSLDQIGVSLQKTASGVVNEEHDIVQCFAAFCNRLEKLAETRAALEEVNDAFSRISHFEKRALGAKTAGSQGLIPKAWGAVRDTARAAAPIAGEAAGGAAGALFGQGAGQAIGGGVSKAVQYSPHVAAAIGAKETYDRLKNSRAVAPLHYAASLVPGTQENYMREYRLQNGG